MTKARDRYRHGRALCQWENFVKLLLLSLFIFMFYTQSHKYDNVKCSKIYNTGIHAKLQKLYGTQNRNYCTEKNFAGT